MAIYLRKTYDDKDTLNKHMMECHKALVASPSYMSGEIAIVQEDNESFTVCIGVPNTNDMRMEWKS